MLDRVFVTSSDVASILYNDQEQMMEVDFVRSGPYVYFNIPFKLYSEFLAAESKGKFVYKVLRNGPYPYNKGPMADALELTSWVPDFELTDLSPE